MYRIIRRSICTAALALLSPTLATPVMAQDYPQRPVKIVVGFAPGGATDIIARLIARNLQEKWSQPFVVENRPGAGGNIAHEAVAKAPGDGYTLLFTSAPLTINPSLYRKLGYDSIRDFTPVTLVATVPSLMLVPANSEIRTMKDFLATARANPGKLDYGSAGNGTPQHLAMELLKSMAGISLVHIPYKGGAPAVADLIAGQTHTMFAAFPEAAPQVQGGRLRALAISADKRSPRMPDLPTVAESGVPGFVAVGWQGLLAPAATPPAVVQALHAAVAEAMARPAVRAQLDAMGIEVSGDGPDAFKAFIGREVQKWAKVVERSGARVD